MKQRNRTMFRPNRKLLSCALASCLAMAAPHVMAQSTSATLRGAVTADSTVTVTNVDTGLTAPRRLRTATTTSVACRRVRTGSK